VDQRGFCNHHFFRHHWMQMVSAQLLALLGISQVASSDGVSLGVGRSFGFFKNPVDKAVLAAGQNSYGQLGVDTSNATEPTPLAVKLPDGEDIMDVAAGAFHSLFVSESGVAYSTGRNNFGQLGYTVDGSQMIAPGRIEALERDPEDSNATAPTVQGVAAGYGHSIFLMSDGSVRSVGLNNQGQLGDGTEVSRTEFVVPNVGEAVKAIAAGYDFSYFLTVSGDVYATGNNLGGQLGDSTREPRTRPVKVLSSIMAISAGEAHGLFLTVSGSVLATGANFDGQVGADTDFVVSPMEIVSQDATSICAGGDSTTLVTESQLWGQGSNRFGQLALGNVTTTSTKMQIGSEVESMGFAEAAVGDTHGLFLAASNFVYASGSNMFGQLGDSTYQSSTRLEQIYAYEPVTHTITTTENVPVLTTQTLTTTADNGDMTSTVTESATVTSTATATGIRGGQSNSSVGVIGRVAIIGVIVLLVMVALGLDSTCCGKKEPQTGGELDDRGAEMMRAQLST